MTSKMMNSNVELTKEIISNINYWLYAVEDAKQSGDIGLEGLSDEESNIAKAFNAGINLPEAFDLSINLICQISPTLTSGPRTDEWIALISMAINNIPQKYENRLCVLYNLVGFMQAETNNPSRAFHSYQQARSHASLENNVRELGIAKLGIARHFMRSNQYDLAMDHALEVIRELESEKSLKGIIVAGWNILGVIAMHRQNFQEAKQFFNLVMGMYSAQTWDSQYAAALGNLAILFWQEEKHLQCLKYLARSRRVFVNQHNYSCLHQIDYLFGITFAKLEWWGKAQKSFLRANISCLTHLPNLSFLRHLYICIATTCHKDNNIELATYYLNKSIQLSYDVQA